MQFNSHANWINKLRQTKLPLIRELVKAGRLGKAITRLRQTQENVGDLKQQVHALQDQITCLTNTLTGLANQTNRLSDRTDLLKSALEVPREWFDDFATWKQQNPIPHCPLVSICLATYNRAPLLTERCLPSLLRQTYSNIEIVVVGDSCTDDTPQRIASLNDSRIRFLNLPQRGLYPDEPRRRWQVAGTVPMNRALGLCKGDFVTHLDDDDEHDPSRIKKLVAFAQEHNIDFIWHPFWAESPDGRWELKQCNDLQNMQVTTSSVFYRRWLTCIAWDINAHMLDEAGDWNRFRKFKYLGAKTARFPEALLRHYREGSQRHEVSKTIT